ncbi:hypothetical protein QT969_25435 [Rhodococcus sp. CSLK01-03]|uniref:Integral membrane protein n=1 Tax=Rhodococcus indonesiensis TaxID=3055869 RepID=A0ABT7RWK0_9NOCA|nr:hypothetical protein [Rhodococcus indonesiensis]MDM7491624.1 hypothetical protein [Rhodococcus indonesiensis]
MTSGGYEPTPDPQDPNKYPGAQPYGPPPGYGPPQGYPPGYGAPPPGYGPPQGPPPQYGAPQYGAPQYGGPQYGGAPQQPGAPYGPPPAGGPAGYGPPPGYGAPGGYPPPGFGSPRPQIDIGAALSYGWRKFSENVGGWLSLVGVIVVAALVFGALMFGVVMASTTTDRYGDSTGMSGVGIAVMIVLIVAFVIGMLVVQAAGVRGALYELDGHKPALKDFFRVGSLGPILLASLLIALGTLLGSLVIVGGIVVAFLTVWTLHFVIDQRQDAVTAIKSSASAAAANVGQLILLWLVLSAINFVGALLCYVGLLVTVPVTTIAYAYAYRVATGGRVAP